jgi:hypothetical protein
LKKEFTRTEFLYDVEASYFRGMEFYEAIEERLNRATTLRHILVHKNNNKDTTRINAITKAIDWNNSILKENR